VSIPWRQFEDVLAHREGADNGDPIRDAPIQKRIKVFAVRVHVREAEGGDSAPIESLARVVDEIRAVPF
jgi:hypothetical protein